VNIAIIDTESTGVDLRAEPISVCILLLEVDQVKGTLIRELDRYVGFRYPSVPIHRLARAKHGITRDSLAGKEFDTTRIAEILGKAEVLIAHNSSFDARMMNVVWPDIAKKDWLCSCSNWPWPALDSRKLDSVCRYFDIDRPKIHSALGDCEALRHALLKHSGKTEQSRTYLALLLRKTPQQHSYEAPYRVAPELTIPQPETNAWAIWLVVLAFIVVAVIVLLLNLN